MLCPVRGALAAPPPPPPTQAASTQAPKRSEQPSNPLLSAAVTGLSALVLLTGSPAVAEFKLPPISSDPDRCERGYVGNTIGQVSESTVCPAAAGARISAASCAAGTPLHLHTSTWGRLCRPVMPHLKQLRQGPTRMLLSSRHHLPVLRPGQCCVRQGPGPAQV